MHSKAWSFVVQRGKASMAPLGIALLGTHTWERTREYGTHFDTARAALLSDKATSLAEAATALEHVEAAQAVLQQSAFVWHERCVPTVLAAVASALGLSVYSESSLRQLRAHAQYRAAKASMREQLFGEALRLLSEVVSNCGGYPQPKHAETSHASWSKSSLQLAWSGARETFDAVDAGGDLLITARAYNGLGRLWYAMGDDTAAAVSFQQAATLADKHSREAAIAAEDAKGLNVAWRLCVTARTNLLQVLTTADDMDPMSVYALLCELCGRKEVSGPISRPYCGLDNAWLSRQGGGLRVYTAIGAGLVNLLSRNCIPEADVARVEALAERAFADGDRLVSLASPSHMAMHNFHCALFRHWQGHDVAAASAARAAYNNLTGQPAHRTSQLHVRLEAHVRLLMFELSKSGDTMLDINKLMRVLVSTRERMKDQRDASHLNKKMAVEARLQRLLDGRAGCLPVDKPPLSSKDVHELCTAVEATLQVLDANVLSHTQAGGRESCLRVPVACLSRSI